MTHGAQVHALLAFSGDVSCPGPSSLCPGRGSQGPRKTWRRVERLLATEIVEEAFVQWPVFPELIPLVCEVKTGQGCTVRPVARGMLSRGRCPGKGNLPLYIVFAW